MPSKSNPKSKGLTRRPSPIPMQLTKRDEKIILRCFEDKLLSTSFLKKLYFPSLASCSRRLRILFSNHYLDRAFFSATPPSMGKKEAYYSLGKRGEGLVALKLGLNKEQIKSQRRGLKRQIKSHSILFTLAHIKAISQIRSSFERAFRMFDQAEVINWAPERLLEQRFKEDGERLKLRPDAFMQYHIFKIDKKYSAFLEVDLGTESKEQIQEKVRRYLAFSNTDLPQKRFSAPLFRVIILTTSEQRSENIKSAIEGVTDKIFWITDFAKLKGNFLDQPVFLRVGFLGRYRLIEG